MEPLKLRLLPDSFVVAKLSPDENIPAWASGPFVSVTRTETELSIVCHNAAVPAIVQAERDWRCLCVVGVLDFSLVGIISSITTRLAEQNISVFVISTFETDYVMVKEPNLDATIDALTAAGMSVETIG